MRRKKKITGIITSFYNPSPPNLEKEDENHKGCRIWGLTHLMLAKKISGRVGHSSCSVKIPVLPAK